MIVTIEPGASEKERRATIESACDILGQEVYSTCQASKKIEAVAKERLTEEVCNQYAKENVETFLSAFSSGTIGINISEEQLINLANFVSLMNEEQYQSLLEQIRELKAGGQK